MGMIDKLKPGVTSVGGGVGSTINWLHVEADTQSATAFSGIALTVNASGTEATYYYWPSTSGVLRYGTTAPTVATQDSAGSAV